MIPCRPQGWACRESPPGQVATDTSEPLGEEQAQPCRSPAKPPPDPQQDHKQTPSPSWPPPLLQPCSPHPGPAPAPQLLTGKDNHVHAPEDAHDPAHHDDGREDLDEGRGDVQPEDTAHVPVREVRAGATQHGEGRDERPCERPEGTAFGGDSLWRALGDAAARVPIMSWGPAARPPGAPRGTTQVQHFAAQTTGAHARHANVPAWRSSQGPSTVLRPQGNTDVT